MAFVDAIDSHYQFVKARIKEIAPTRIVAGMLNARDWPYKEAKLEAFYLLSVTDAPGPSSMISEAIPIVSHQVQWSWLIAGDDLRPEDPKRSANRAKRFRLNKEMQGELLKALTPRFCEKQNWQMVNGVWTGTPLNEYIMWTVPRFVGREDKDTGLVYGMALVNILNMTDEISA